MPQLSDNLRGAFLMVGAMCGYTINDAFMKSAAADVPLFQAILIRGIGAVICLTIMCRLLGQLRFDLPRKDWSLIVLRGLCEVGGTYFFLTALLNMPIANITAILQVLPLSVSLAAALLLGAALGWRRLLAIMVGFLGVLMVIQPGGTDFNGYSIYALIAVACVTLRDIVVRQMSADVPPVLVALVAAVGVTLLGAVGSAFTSFVPLTVAAGLKLMGAMTCLIFGYIFSVTAMKHGDISFVAPFRYTSLLVALIIGFFIFDELPNVLALCGAAIVIATGLFTLYREAKLRVRHKGVPDRIR
ncbi:DMT family transporter [Yoonia sp. 2307UL14-13]|uniref:DMT family transporter n=1 Tax=Yoonia sp. 2307UL14-13 TaxID=3126506 RepID=UPI0030A000A7